MVDHRRHHGHALPRAVAGAHHAPEPVQHDAGDGVHHRGERGEGDHVARRLDGLLLGLAGDALHPLLGGVRRQVPQLRHDAQGVRSQEVVEPAVGAPGPQDRPLVHAARLGPQAFGDEGPHLVEAHEALGRLLGVVEGMRVQERPDELPAHVLEAELEVRVLVDRVVAPLEGEGADGLALGGGDLVGLDDAGRVAGASSRDGPCVGLAAGAPEGDLGRAREDHEVHSRAQAYQISAWAPFTPGGRCHRVGALPP